MITLANIKRSQLTLTFAFLSILLLTTSCPETAEDLDSPGESSQEESTEVEEITRDNGTQETTFIFERNDSKDEYTSINDDMGVYAEIVRSGSVVTIKHGNPIPIYTVDLNTGNRITQTLYDSGPFRLRSMAGYSGNQIKQLSVYNETLQPDSSFIQELSMELTGIDIDKNGGVLVFTVYAPGTPPIVFDAEVTCLNTMNNLRNNVPFSVMLDFNDGLNNFTNQFDYPITSMKFTNRANNTTLTMSYNYKFDNQDRIIEKTQVALQPGTNDIIYRVKYFNN